MTLAVELAWLRRARHQDEEREDHCVEIVTSERTRSGNRLYEATVVFRNEVWGGKRVMAGGVLQLVELCQQALEILNFILGKVSRV